MKILIFLILLIISGCDSKKDDSYSYLTEKIFYPSKNILGFENIFNSNLSTQNDVEIFGVMHFPDNYDSAKKYPLVIASHGSYNWRSHHLKYLEQIRNANFIVLLCILLILEMLKVQLAIKLTLPVKPLYMIWQ